MQEAGKQRKSENMRGMPNPGMVNPGEAGQGVAVHGDRAQPVDMVRRGKTPSGEGDDPIAYGTGFRRQGLQDQAASRAPVIPGFKNYDYELGCWSWEEKRRKEIQEQIAIIQAREAREDRGFKKNLGANETRKKVDTRTEVSAGAQVEEVGQEDRHEVPEAAEVGMIGSQDQVTAASNPKSKSKMRRERTKKMKDKWKEK